MATDEKTIKRCQDLLKLANGDGPEAERIVARKAANAIITKYNILEAELAPKPVAKFKPEEFNYTDPFAGFKGSMDAVEMMRREHQARKERVVGYVKNAKQNLRPLKILKFIKDVVIPNDDD